MAEEFVNVRVAQGALRGRKVTANGGNRYFSFQGVPYAKPPVGPLRFKVARPAEPWNGVRDALAEGPSCPQVDWLMKGPYRGDEDCLYVNVYSPKLPSASQTLNYPVMVWIHGGGFEVGSGNADMYGPDYLVGEDVVLVTFNYRLGIFGFLSLDDASVPCNVGLKDQVAALRWVKANIAVFGGDPNNVTIFGESAGGASVHFHMLSPMSRGLFHRAIIQSGCALSSWAISENPQELAFNLAKELGSNASNVQEVLSFLSNVPAPNLVKKQDELKKLVKNFLPRFLPTLEKHAPGPGDEVFLPALPQEIMEKRQYDNSIPVMIGVTSQEGILVLDQMDMLQKPENVNCTVENVKKLLKLSFKTTSSETERAVKEFYLAKQNPLQALISLTSDIMVTKDVEETTKILSEGASPVFYYNFDFSGKLNFYKHFAKASELSGASHMDELGYLFANPFFKVPDVAPDSPEGVTRKRMLRLWTNFAKTGNPTPEPDSVIGIKWPRYTVQKAEYMDVGNTLSVQRELNKDRMEFWKKMKPNCEDPAFS